MYFSFQGMASGIMLLGFHVRRFAIILFLCWAWSTALTSQVVLPARVDDAMKAYVRAINSRNVAHLLPYLSR
jgi:hypothetical protein